MKPRGADYVFFITGLVLTCTRLVFNWLPISAAIRFRRLSSIDILIISLCTCEITMVVFLEPLSTMAFLNEGWFGGKITCNFYQVCGTWFTLARMVIFALLAHDRWRLWKVKVDEGNFGLISQNLQSFPCKVLVIAAFVGTFAISLLPLSGLSHESLSKSSKYCESWLMVRATRFQEEVFFLIFISLSAVCLLLCGLFTIQLYMSYSMERRQKRDSDASIVEASGLQRSACQDLIKSTLMVMYCALLFWAVWIPVLVIIILHRFVASFDGKAFSYGFELTGMPSLFHVLLFGVLLKRYRAGYKRTLRWIFACCLTGDDQDGFAAMQQEDPSKRDAATTYRTIPEGRDSLEQNLMISYKQQGHHNSVISADTVDGSQDELMTDNSVFKNNHFYENPKHKH